MRVKPSYILSSPLLRARQTAEIAAKALKFSAEIEILEELKNGSSANALLKALKSYPSDSQIVLTGHMPSLSEHLAAWIGLENAASVPLGKGGMAYVELEPLRAGAGQLRWLMRQKQLQLFAD